ncbi:hypothetical protein ZHAS_00016800 [Anopheles sinensis]|uniref:Uncharacterized protein n=1 Tax=Anopheles sinensis TaxID=74873 RepID=A0A084WE71_ANOSI|nr:hypothetical protein ZHAS_00016800 [Anopheles sinensis]
MHFKTDCCFPSRPTVPKRAHEILAEVFCTIQPHQYGRPKAATTLSHAATKLFHPLTPPGRPEDVNNVLIGRHRTDRLRSTSVPEAEIVTAQLVGKLVPGCGQPFASGGLELSKRCGTEPRRIPVEFPPASQGIPCRGRDIAFLRRPTRAASGGRDLKNAQVRRVTARAALAASIGVPTAGGGVHVNARCPSWWTKRLFQVQGRRWCGEKTPGSLTSYHRACSDRIHLCILYYIRRYLPAGRLQMRFQVALIRFLNCRWFCRDKMPASRPKETTGERRTEWEMATVGWSKDSFAHRCTD